MKSIKSITLLAAAVLLVTACNKSEDLAPQADNFPTDGVIRVATEVNKPQTRAGMTSDNLTDFFIYVENPVETSGKYNYFAKMKKEGGVWKSYTPQSASEISQGLPAAEAIMLWQNKMTHVNVTAFRFPFSVVGSNWTNTRAIRVQPDQTTAENLEKSDLLYMGKTQVNPATDLTPDGKLKVKLDHRLAKLNLTLKLGTEFNLEAGGTTQNPITEVKVEGTKTSVKWNPQTNVMGELGNLFFIAPFMAKYTPGEADTKMAEAAYECILLPQSIEANTFAVIIKIGGKTYLWTQNTGLVFGNNTRYNLTLNVGKDAVTLGSFSIQPWGDGGSHDAETE